MDFGSAFAASEKNERFFLTNRSFSEGWIAPMYIHGGDFFMFDLKKDFLRCFLLGLAVF